MGCAGLAAWALAACGERAPGTAVPGGALLIATGSDADALLPPLVKSSVGKQVADALFLPLARIGDALNLVGDEGFDPGLAARWEWASDSASITFHLDPRARWHDGTPVRAPDVAFSLRAYRDPAVASDAVPHLASVDSITVRDSLTFVAWYAHRSATQFYDLVYHLIPIPEHVYGTVGPGSLASSAAARRPVGSGRFRLARWLAGELVEVVADTGHWEGRPYLDRVVWLAIPDPAAQVARLLAGEADLVESLRGDALNMAGRDSTIRVIRRPAFDFAIAVFNLRDPASPSRPHPLFAERELRRALTLALDRATLVASVLDSVGAPMSSPYLSAHQVTGADLLPYDTLRAAALLDSLGWRDTNGDGVREKGGRDLAFTISAPVSSGTRVRASTIMQEMFRRAGARVDLRHVENAVMMADNEAGKFDLSLLGFSASPAPSVIRQYWTSNQGGQGTNWGHYASPAFDAVIDSAVRATQPAESRRLHGRAGRILAEDAPAIWLYELRTFTGLHHRFRPAVMRPDAWWAHLDQWSVDPVKLKDRDRIGPGTPPP
jgi:peptide/nickel transport system substrate-binding protein